MLNREETPGRYGCEDDINFEHFGLKSLHKILQKGSQGPLSNIAPCLSTYHYITLSCTWLNLPGLMPSLLFLYIQNWTREGLRAKANFVKYTYSPSLIPRPVWEWALWSIHSLILSPHSTAIVISSTSSCVYCKQRYEDWEWGHMHHNIICFNTLSLSEKVNLFTKTTL